MSKIAALEFEQVSRQYGGRHALRSVGLALHSGEIMALVGPNGSGKSTLLRVAAALLAPDGGRLVRFGRDGPVDHARIGVLFDHAVHWETLSGYENAWFFARSYGLSPPEALARLDRLFGRLDLAARRDDPVATYSFGMRRKLAVIEALAHAPPLLLLDEPSLGLDHPSRASLRALLREAACDGAAVLLSTNDVHEAAHSDRVALLADGRVVATGDPSALIRSLDGAVRVELELAAGTDLGRLRGAPGIRSVRHEDGIAGAVTVLLDPAVDTTSEPPVVRVVREVSAAGGRIRALRVVEPDLGDVLAAAEAGRAA